MRSGQLVPHSLVDNHHILESRDLSLEGCLGRCREDTKCTGAQYRAETHPACILRKAFEAKQRPDDTCAANWLTLAQDRGFKDMPMVRLTDSDGTVYMRKDCMETMTMLSRTTYWGIPWDWEQPGLSLVDHAGYGVSPLLGLVTPSILKDLVTAGVPPWQAGAGDLQVDIACDSASSSAWEDIVEQLRHAPRRQQRHALLLDIGKCICPILSSGWDPAKDLLRDVVLLLHRDENFSPATPFMKTARFAEINTNIPCIKRGDGKSVFASDAEAFLALADNPRTLGMYFMQTPPIRHEKVFLTPLGVDKKIFTELLESHFRPSSPDLSRTRTALYEVSHNMAVNYRRDVFRAVQEAFGREPLHQRHVPWASGSRMADVVEETFQTVFGQSPIGIGENCFRHYELLLAGAIPVVQASLGVAALRYLPHLAVSNWHEVTPELLRRSYPPIWSRVQRGDFTFEPLTNRFWRRHILDTAHRRGVPEFYAKFPNPPVTCGNWNCTKPL